jgi:hypothetical protein
VAPAWRNSGRTSSGYRKQLPRHLQRIEKREDEATKKLGDMARAFDPSEIYAVELEETVHRQTLMDCREAMEAMRDYAGEIYRVETGRPFSTVKAPACPPDLPQARSRPGLPRRPCSQAPRRPRAHRPGGHLLRRHRLARP